MEEKGAETNQNSVRALEKNNNYQNFAPPPSYDDVICTQQISTHGRHNERESIQQQPIQTKSVAERPIYGRE